jgi:hypothetical protein
VSPVSVLIVDDEPDERAGEIAEDVTVSGEVIADSVHPQRLSRGDIDNADLILVDYRLGEWIETRDADERETKAAALIADRPRDGLALAAVIRSQLPRDEERIRGVALLSANLTDLVRNFARPATEHTAARFNSVEWAFDKTEIEGLPVLANRIRSFAAAVGTLNERWPAVEAETDREEALTDLLALHDNPWTDIARRDIHAAQAPLNQYATATHGLSVLRWLAQRVLPYPTFLLDARRLAMACGIMPEVASDRDRLRALEGVFDGARYRGPLGDFLGPRWWRAGVQHLVRESSGDTLPGPEVAAAVERQAGVGLPRLDPPGAVLGIDGELNVIGAVPRERAVRIRPDDWPPFAETGWLPEGLLEEHPGLIDLIDPVDRVRLEG